MSRFFISYSRQDGKELAQKLRRSISRLDSTHDVFVDEKSIVVGIDWKEKIANSIKRCDYFILILSPSSINSEWVKKEVELAQESELKTGMKKLFVIKQEDAAFPDFIPSDHQLLELTDDWCIDFYRLMSGVFANQSFYSIEENISMLDKGYDIELSVSSLSIYKDLIHSVEYRFDYGFAQTALAFKKVLLCKKKENNYKIEFWTSENITVFVVVYLKNSKQVNIIHKVEVG